MRTINYTDKVLSLRADIPRVWEFPKTLEKIDQVLTSMGDGSLEMNTDTFDKIKGLICDSICEEEWLESLSDLTMKRVWDIV